MDCGFIVLSHQGLSQVANIAEALHQRGMRCFVLSSRSVHGRGPDWVEQVHACKITDQLFLDWNDLNSFATELRQSYKIKIAGCISVWDGYRELMARFNQVLGVTDTSPAVVRRINDKLFFRQYLHKQGLSKANAGLLDTRGFDEISANLDRYFIKPRRGLASWGAFRGDKLTSFSDLQPLRKTAAQDAAYAGVFSADLEFIYEDLIQGIEFCFEVVVDRSECVVVAVHEKVDLTDHDFTVLENACVCPPRSISGGLVEAGRILVTKCLGAMEVDTGIYHVEARFDAMAGWELIEVNPRIGGAYIVDSTRIHSNVDLLGTWIDLLLGHEFEKPSFVERTTFFRVFFGRPGKTISHFRYAQDRWRPVLEKTFFQAGDTLPEVDREIFVGQALWDITEMNPDSAGQFIEDSFSYLTIGYNV